MSKQEPTPAPVDEHNSAAEGLSAQAGPTPSAASAVERPSYLFLGVMSMLTLAVDLGTKWWAKARLEDRPFFDRHIEVIHGHFSLTYAENRGGAWGLLQNQPESIRQPFFLTISVLAIVFIVSLYRKLTPQQLALKWGLPLVLGGALGNLINRIQYNVVVDFLDFRAGWVRWLNGLFSRNPTDHWPTFNVADVTIVAGVILMAIDMFAPRPKAPVPVKTDAPTPAPKET